MRKRKILTIIGVVAFPMSILMIAIGMVFGTTTASAWIYFSSFLFLVFIGNVTMEKSQVPLTLKETRKEKISNLNKI